MRIAKEDSTHTEVVCSRLKTQIKLSQETAGFETAEEAGIPTKEMRVDVSDTEAYRTRRQDETILTPVYIADHQDNCTASTSCLLH